MTAFSNKTNKEFIPYEVKGYLISAPLTANNAGNCMWGFAEKYGKRFFIKQFLNPKFPDANAEIYESTRIRKSTSKYILTTTTEKLVVTKPTEPVTSTIPQTTNNSTSTTTTQYIPPTTKESTTEPETTQPETSIPTIEIPTTTETMQDTSISTEPSIVPTAAQVSLYEVLIPKYAVICIQSEKLF